MLEYKAGLNLKFKCVWCGHTHTHTDFPDKRNQARAGAWFKKHLRAASSTENGKENAVRHGLARRTKNFRVGQKFLTQSLKNFIIG